MYSTPIQFATHLERAGIPVPKAATTELATLLAITEARTADPLAALLNAAHEGKVTSKTAADHVAQLADAIGRSEHIEAAARQLEQPIVARWYAALRASEDELMSAIAERAAEPLAVVQEAGRHFGTDARSDDVLGAGVEAVKTWEALTGAVAKLDLLRNIRAQLGDLWHHGEQDVTWWIAGADDGAHLEHAHRAFTAPGNAFHNLAAEGFTLRVNGKAEAEQVASGARLVDAKREQAETERRAAGLREVDDIRRAN